MDRSIRRLGVFLMVLFVALFAQLNYLQVFRADDLNRKPGNTRPVDQAFNRPRGTVSTADGVVVARSVKSDGRFEYQRLYPEGETYASITGYFNYAFGATGLETAYNSELTGRTAKQQLRNVGDLFVKKDRVGNVKLTVRSDVQQAAKEALGRRRGSVVALDPRNGSVLALWSYPSYDPNQLSDHNLEKSQMIKASLEQRPDHPMLAKSYRETFAPGSTFKVVTAATGVESGQVTADRPSYPFLSSLDLPQTTRNLPNFGGGTCGGTLFEILAKSCNSAFAQMGLDLGGDRMRKGAHAFGFDSVPPFDLPTVASVFPDMDFKENQPALAQAAIGQGSVTATPLQMALVAAGIANGGEMMKPHVVDEVRDGEGDVVMKRDPEVWRRAVSADAAGVVMEAMRAVVDRGSATRLQIPGLDVGAKTGTAQTGATRPLKSHAWVTAWAGKEGQEPEVVVAVIVEAQDGMSEQTGGRVAAPIARQVIERATQPAPSGAGQGQGTGGGN